MEDIATFVEPSTLEFFTNLHATKLVYIAPVEREDVSGADDHFLDVEVNIFARSEIGYAREKFKNEIKKMPFGSLKMVKDLLFTAINKKFLDKGDKVLCVVDEGVGIGYKGVMFVFDIDHILVSISRHKLSDKISPEILEVIIDIATELSNEGREGKKIGTAFIVGNKEDIMKYVKQLVLNPFLGYMESKIKVTDPTVRETIKEFSQLDGVFIVDTDGAIITSCAYLDVPTDGVDLQGFGTKHLNCAAITKQTDSISVVLSSTGTIRVFKDGKIVMKL